MNSPVLLLFLTWAQWQTGLLVIWVIILASDLCLAQYSYICSSCDTQSVSINCEWSSWSWSQCSATCGPGVEVGRRFVTRYSDLGGRPCGSKTRDTRSCNLGPCVTNCLWGEWTKWACSETCGEGREYRTRGPLVRASNGGQDCEGKSYQLGGQCNERCCVQDCQWSAWTWDSCSVTCGGGQRVARRRVVREAECGGRACDPEAGARTEPCPTVSACPCSWGAWDNWGAWSTGVYDLFRGALVRTRQRMRREEGGETCSATERDLDEETGTTTTTTTTTSAPVPSPTKDDIEVALVVFPILVAVLLLLLLLVGIGFAFWWFCYRRKKRTKTVTITTEEVETLEEKKSEKRLSESSMHMNRASQNRQGARSRSSICEMLQVFSASLPLSQSSRRLTPSQEEIVTSREDGETEQEYIRARPEGDIYVNSGRDLGIRNGNEIENRESDGNDEDVVRVPINYLEQTINARSSEGLLEINGNEQQNRITTVVSENVSRDIHDYENWTPKVLPTSAPDKTKEVRFKLPSGKK